MRLSPAVKRPLYIVLSKGITKGTPKRLPHKSVGGGGGVVVPLREHNNVGM